MQYAVIADAYEKIEATAKRLEMTDLLVDLLKEHSERNHRQSSLFDAGETLPRLHGH